jgi:hypothetical protein
MLQIISPPGKMDRLERFQLYFPALLLGFVLFLLLVETIRPFFPSALGLSVIALTPIHSLRQSFMV